MLCGSWVLEGTSNYSYKQITGLVFILSELFTFLKIGPNFNSCFSM
jgi:hypothetical protein